MDILSRTHCLGASLIFLGLICIFANMLLIFPNFEYQFLLQRKVSLYALMMSGLWGGGVLVFIAARQFMTKHSKAGFWRVRSTMLCSIPYSALGLLGSGICFVVNFTGLAKGPFCQYLTCDQETSWGYPLQARSTSEVHYIYNNTQWYTVCMEPHNVVVWNIILFSIILLANILQALLCVIQIINGVAGVFFGAGNRHNKRRAKQVTTRHRSAKSMKNPYLTRLPKHTSLI
ncbi:transmembrane 4 L6 family member 1-like isoform X1 [Polypterus senegalus]|uniref:transmembrane 4 L6 family member 1-like isoform X1 n=1 Tax=Polypterus senegalus TaxID=55291 RepID=UPI0019640004|nr:transmembrane 4 L6 family member 1-like isoform X1 [Polypterus senegalus]